MPSDDDLLKYNTEDEAEEPQIRFGTQWIPAHQAWAKIQTANAVVDVIDHFNTRFPLLASSLTRSAVPTARVRFKDLEIRNPKEQSGPDYAAIAIELLNRLDPESVLDELASAHNHPLSLQELIFLAGEKHYIAALKKEAVEFEQNLILSSQTAEIWNEMSRPAPGGGLWSQNKIDKLIGGAFDKVGEI